MVRGSPKRETMKAPVSPAVTRLAKALRILGPSDFTSSSWSPMTGMLDRDDEEKRSSELELLTGLSMTGA
jgi:hypothetical protein